MHMGNAYMEHYTPMLFQISLHTEIRMMTSSNEGFFRGTDPLCGEFIGHRWIPHTKGQ